MSCCRAHFNASDRLLAEEMERMPMFPCLNHATLMTTDLEMFLDAAAEAGFKLVELRHPMLEQYLAEHSHRRLRAQLRHLGISVAALNALMDWSLTPEENYRFVLTRAEGLLALCELVETDLLICVPSLIAPAADEVSRPEKTVLETTAARLKRLASLARSSGVRLALEQVGRPSSRPDASSSVRSIDDALAVVHAAGDSNVSLVVDSFNFFTGGNRLEALRSIPIDGISMLHAADAPSPDPAICGIERLMPGEGSLDLTGFRDVMVERGYQGPWSVELFNPSIWQLPPSEAAALAMAAIRRYIP